MPVNRSLRLSLFLMLLTVISTWVPSAATEFAFFHENVLGTSLELRIETNDPLIASKAENIALATIDHFNELFSHYSPSSEFSKFCRLPIGESMQLSSELVSLLKRCERWSLQSDGAFNVGAEAVVRKWQQGSKEGTVPNSHELIKIVREANLQHWSVDAKSNRITRCSETPLTLNAIAKGTILDAVSQAILDQVPEVKGVSINIGGDIRVTGNTSQKILIPHPARDLIGAPPLQMLTLTQGAIATSGTSERSLTIGSQSYSHIMDPRTGQPCDHVISASVIANDAETADVLATICSVLPTTLSLALIDSIPGAMCLLVDLNGALIASPNWPEANPQEGKLAGGSDKQSQATPSEFNITFEINKASEGGRYRRPYVAVWVEDKDGFPVKTLSLFLMADNPGPRWHRDLRRWYSSDQMRLLVDQKKLIGTVSKPTRNPGLYKVAWDGTDDNDKALPTGKYTLYIEAAREHGTYQLMKSPFSLGAGEFELKLDGNEEIKSAAMTFKQKK